MTAFARRIAARPGAVLLGVALLTALALPGIVDPRSGEMRLQVDPSLNEMLPQEDEGRRFYEALLERFGSDDTLVVALVADDLFSEAGFERIRRVTRELQALPGVHHVDSLATATRLRAAGDELDVSGFLDPPPEPDLAPDYGALRRELAASPLLGGSLVSRDGRATALVVTFLPMSEEEFQTRELDRVVERRAREVAPEARVWVAGTPRVKAEITRILTSELGFMVPLILGGMAVLSYAFFRRLALAWIPVASVVIAMVWTLGFMGWTGQALDIVTTLIPPLVLIVGFAYAIHVVAAHGRELAPGPRSEDAARPAAAAALSKVGFAVFFTAFTTAAGFLSLTTSSLAVIRSFGLYSVAAVCACLAASLLFTPAALAWTRPRPEHVPDPGRSWDRLFTRLAAFSLAHRRGVLAAGGVLFAVSLLGSTRVVVDMEVIGNFERDSDVRRSYQAINRLFDGANVFYVMIEGADDGTFLEPANLRQLEQVQRWLETQPEIGGTTSMVDHLRIIHRAFAGGGAEAARLPDSRRLAAQLLAFGANEELENLVDRRHRTATIRVHSTATSSREFERLGQRIDARLAELPAHLSGRATGNAVLLTRASDAISRGQARSLIAACAMIGAVLCLYFRSLTTGLVALVPNVLPVAFYFGLMGATGVTLNNATALMGSIVLGIAVDDTIHFLVHFRRALPTLSGDRTRAAIQALGEVGRPVTYTSIVLCLGLLVVATSALETQAHFGALGAATLAFAWAVDVVFTPALCTLLSPPGTPRSGAAPRQASSKTITWRPTASPARSASSASFTSSSPMRAVIISSSFRRPSR